METTHMDKRISSLRFLALLMIVGLTSCAQLVEKPIQNFSNNLTDAVLSQNDPEIVRQGAPTFMLMLDGMVRQSPDSATMLGAASQIYALYTNAFVKDENRVKKLSSRSFDYAERAYCVDFGLSQCDLTKMDFDAFQTSVDRAGLKDVPTLSALSTAWLLSIRANSADWGALGQLPKAEALLKKVIELDRTYQNGSAIMFSGILNSLRPPALGGKPELAKEYFEEAIALSNGNNLAAKVEYASSYARSLYERDLHDKLLNQVLAADPESDGYTLMNLLAQEQAKSLLASADDYF